jgi:benzylsuccinate CoA-transferase BbsF subunit
MSAATTPAESATERAPAPLTGVRVVDFTSYASGPYCGLMLALLGAEVIRIESRTRLDLNRRPHPLYGRFEIPVYDQLSAHKKSVTLDLKSDVGKQLARELITASDVVIENFRPGVMERLGLAWPEVHAINSKVVMVSISAYGQTGPESRRPGYAPVFGAEGGLGFIQGYPDGPPLEVRNQMDHQVGLTGALTAVALLEERELTGVGRRADIAACEVATMLVGESVIAALADPDAELRLGNDHELWAPHGIYPTAGDDAWIAIAVRDDAEWAALAKVVGPELFGDQDLARAETRRSRRDELNDALAEWTHRHDGRTLAAELQAAGVCADVSMSAQDLLDDEHLRERGSLTDIEHLEHGRRTVVQTPWRYQVAESDISRWSPDIGEHNEQIITGLLGHSREELDAWVAEKAVN